MRICEAKKNGSQPSGRGVVSFLCSYFNELLGQKSRHMIHAGAFFELQDSGNTTSTSYNDGHSTLEKRVT